MWLKEARIDAQLSQTDVVPRLKAVEPRADASCLSRYENGVCLPTPAQFQALCETYGKQPRELYALEEVDLGIAGKKAKKKDAHRKAGYQLFARVPAEVISDPVKFKRMLKACGYPNVIAWVCQCIKRLECEYASRQKNKGRSDVTAPKAANK